MQPEVKWIMEYLDRNEILPEVQASIDSLHEWAGTIHGYDSKNQRIREWSPTEFQFYEMVCHIFAGCILHPEGMTYQAMIGYISGTITCADPLDRAKNAAEVIALAYQNDLIVITRLSDKTFMITTEYELDEDMPEFPKHMPEFRKPQRLHIMNQILGNSFKQHDKDTCLDHINRMNETPLTLNTAVVLAMPEPMNEELETQEQIDDWNTFLRRSRDTYNHVVTEGNKFYLTHAYDTRGRTYCNGYYVNYQGSQYKKAIVQLADKEVIEL